VRIIDGYVQLDNWLKVTGVKNEKVVKAYLLISNPEADYKVVDRKTWVSIRTLIQHNDILGRDYLAPKAMIEILKTFLYFGPRSNFNAQNKYIQTTYNARFTHGTKRRTSTVLSNLV
jgi:hypothetical protein